MLSEEKLTLLKPTSSDEQRKLFIGELADLINSHSLEQGSNTPDFALASFLESALQSFNAAIYQRDSFMGLPVADGMVEITSADRHLLITGAGENQVDLVSDGDIIFKIPNPGGILAVKGNLLITQLSSLNNKAPAAGDQKMAENWTDKDWNDRPKAKENGPLGVAQMDKMPAGPFLPIHGSLWRNIYSDHTVKVTGVTNFEGAILILCIDIFSSTGEVHSVRSDTWLETMQPSVESV